MPNVNANGIQIEYETFGDPASPPLLLIAGAGAQMVTWEEAWCDLLAKQGLYVIRFDNRDVGLSSKFDDIPYTLEDMADDTVGLLDALGIEKAHIVGRSLGGMIAQTIAIRHPSRVWSLVSVVSTTGDPALLLGDPELYVLFLAPEPVEREENVEYRVNLYLLLEGSKYPLDKQEVRRMMERSYDRCFCPQSVKRQADAVAASGNRTEALRSVTAPTLVIQGSEDPLWHVECGKSTAEAVPGAELLIVEGMGHLFSAEVWPVLVGAIVQHTQKAMSIES